ncbi:MULTISPECIES: 2-octaprenyl-6-methoxyphenyl hydroxylase [Pseudomonadati]|uniref:2-octaprenyl-6-methoxyphenyl hydroxylase n=1 Tax=Shewanella aestuarii TaxID=1028752 RepID=A0ABT0L1D3_9GAMM|nr:2-octaprenyl-6-methoxyphenyl hydroxylase [Shewanella aestuarii]MCL1117503.1 2-octaprenyl-6-methoxyphenyl hydroxylase [Shewanella aestuarii]GGN75628.1 2-octaprenyl-6-methoxyphenyl hydroxylase [Shewanella aestuarii]
MNSASAALQPFDIVIIGGAMAGATLALGLAKLNQGRAQPLSIALIEAQQADDSHPGFDARSIAIAHGSIFELTRLGIWPALSHLGTAIEDIHISDRGHFGMTELNAKPLGLSALGQVVELAQVGQVLFEQLKQADITLFCPAKLSQLTSDEQGHYLTLDNGFTLSAKLLVAADGANSVVREQLKQDAEQIDFQQSAVVANVETDKPHQHWAYERFTETGPLALLPMSNPVVVQGQAPRASSHARLSLVWAVSPAKAAQLAQTDEADFLQQLQQAFGNRAGRFTQVGKRVTYPLTLTTMPRPIFHRCVFVGNAAQTLHPIAGQGFNLGLRDVVGLIQVIETALKQADANADNNSRVFDVGSSEIVHQYLAARQDDRHSTLRNIEFLVRGFSNQHWPLVAGRSLGLRLLSWLPPLKRPVAQIAMGWR